MLKKLNRSKKAILFNAVLVIIAIGIFIIAYIDLLDLESKKPAEIGEQSLDLLSRSYRGAKLYDFVDSSAGIAIPQALYELEQAGGTLALSCTDFNGFAAWKDSTEKQCIPKREDIKEGFMKKAMVNLEEKFVAHPTAGLQFNNYDLFVSIDDENKKIETIGVARLNAELEPAGAFFCKPIEAKPSTPSQEFLKETYGETRQEIEEQLQEITVLGVKIKVHSRIAPIFNCIKKEIAECEALGNFEIGSYAWQDSEEKSPNSFGIGLEIIPAGSYEASSRILPSCLVDAFKKYGFSWSGDWLLPDNKNHFEFRGDPSALQFGGYRAACASLVTNAEEYVGSPYNKEKKGLLTPLQADLIGTTCASFVQSVYWYTFNRDESQTPTGNGGAMCDDELMQKLGTNVNVLQPGDVFSAYSCTVLGSEYGHTGIFVGTGRVENKIGTSHYKDFIPDPDGEPVFIHSGRVGYNTYSQIFGPGKCYKVKTFCRHTACIA